MLQTYGYRKFNLNCHCLVLSRDALIFFFSPELIRFQNQNYMYQLILTMVLFCLLITVDVDHFLCVMHTISL